MNKTVVLIQEEPIDCYQTIELLVTSAGQFRVPFPDQNQLRSLVGQRIIIKAISIITPDALARAPISGLVTAPLTELQKLSLVLYSTGWERGLNIPLLHLNPLSTPGGTIPHLYRKVNFADWADIDWSKSYISYSGGSTGSNVGGGNYAVLLGVEYSRLGGDGSVLIGSK
jgi:hypothetical protein